MRKVQVFKWEKQSINGCMQGVKVPDFVALFYQFAQEADGEGQSNPVAIVEREDGQVLTVGCSMIQFAPDSRAESPIVDELRKADRIINVMLNTMTLAQQNAAGAKLEAEGVSPDGMTRAHERRAALTAAGAA